MDQRQIALVQDSFGKAAKLGEAVPEIFYAELFAIDPSLRKMFRGEMAEQGRKLLVALDLVVKGLNQPEKIIPVAEKLAVKHVSYGVTAAHYSLVGNALLRTLKKGARPPTSHRKSARPGSPPTRCWPT